MSDYRPTADPPVSTTPPLRAEIDLSQSTMTGLEELIRRVTKKEPRPWRPAALALAIALVSALIVFIALTVWPSRGSITIDATVQPTQLAFRQATVKLAQGRAAGVEISQAAGSRVQLDLPISPSHCDDLAEALNTPAAEKSSCSAGVLQSGAPLTVTWTKTATGDPIGALLSLTGPLGLVDALDVTVTRENAELPAVRVDITGSRVRWCFTVVPTATMTVAAGADSYSTDIERGGAGIDCDHGLHLLVGDVRTGGAIPAVIAHDVSGFSLEMSNRRLAMTSFVGGIDLGSAGSVTIDRPGALHVESGPPPLTSGLEVAPDGSVRVRVSGDGVSSIVAEHGGRQVPTWWERSRPISLPIVTALLAAALTSFVLLVNIFTDRFGLSKRPATQAKRGEQ